MASKNNSQDLDEILKTKDFMKQILQKGSGLVRLSNTLPKDDEMKYYMNNEQLKQKQKAINIRILQQIKKIASFIQYENTQSVDLNHFSHVINLNDMLFENIDTSLDRMKKINNITESSLFDPSKTTNSDRIFTAISGEESGEDIIAIATKEKPQNNFSECIDTSYEYPFTPVIRQKVNAEVPLDDVIMQAQAEGIQSFFKSISNPKEYEFPHPYAYEIENFTYTEQQLQTENLTVQEPISLKEELVYVDNEQVFDEMIESLKQFSEVAIDLEHHSYRSFNGITCLIQISSRQKDYIVDVFSVWRQMHKLNIITTDKNIVKVLHGADMDIQWLQRDFGVYIVNLFDTGQAARVLSMPSYALAYLLQSISKVPSDKKYQLADWRIRPLPKEMISYARSDTHYLLSIYDNLRLQLIQKSIQQGQLPSQMIETVLNKSRTVCLKKYVKPILDDEKYHATLQNQRIILSDRKFRILKKLLEWRFIMGSRYDENPTFVMANDILFKIVNILPSSHKQLLAINLKLSYICQYHANEILQLIKQEVESEEKVKTTETETHQNNQTEMETEDISYFTKQSNIVYSTTYSAMQGEEQEEEEVAFKLETFDIQIGVYQGKMNILEDHIQAPQSNSQDSEIQEKLQRINSSFFYADPVDFYCEKYPFMREAYELAKLQEEEIMKKRNDLAYIQNKNPFDGENEGEVNNGEEGRDEYLAFIKEKGPSSKPKEIEQIEVPDLPLSYEVQFKTNLKKRKYNFGNNQKSQEEEEEEEVEVNENGEKIYKKRAVGQKSTFDMLIEQEFREQSDLDEDDSDEEDANQKGKKKKRVVTEEQKKQMQDDFNQITDKIKNQINKDPRFKSGINQKNYNNKKGANQKNNKFINKFKKNGF